MSANLPATVFFTSAVWTGTYAYVFGGDVNTVPTATNMIARYDPVNDVCSIENQVLPTARDTTSAVWTGTEALIFGGSQGSTFYNQIVEFTPSISSSSATPTPTAPTPTPKSSPTLTPASSILPQGNTDVVKWWDWSNGWFVAIFVAIVSMIVSAIGVFLNERRRRPPKID
jgi:hypothetical protein